MFKKLYIKDQGKDILEKMECFDIEKVDKYQKEYLDDGMIISLLIENIDYYDKLEKYITKNLFYIIVNLSSNYDDNSKKINIIFREKKWSIDIQSFIINIYERMGKNSGIYYVETDDYVKSKEKIHFLETVYQNTLSLQTSSLPEIINLHSLAIKLVNNPNCPFVVLTAIYQSFNRKDSMTSNSNIKILYSIENHPNFSVAKAILRELLEA